VSDEDDSVLEFPHGTPTVSEETVSALEALLFACGEPLTVPAAAETLQLANDEVRAGLRVIEQRRRAGGVVLERVAGGWQLRTAPRFALIVHRLLGTKPQKLSRPALEVLAIVAYHQPVSRSEIERVRGVDSGGVLKSLIDRGLLRSAGRSDEPGRPLLYRSTAAFLELFSLPDLSSLPTLAERAALVRAQPTEAPADEPG
jgi:segregation and condensation protein B